VLNDVVDLNWNKKDLTLHQKNMISAYQLLLWMVSILASKHNIDIGSKSSIIFGNWCFKHIIVNQSLTFSLR
jgi:hypothetical protein